MSSGCSKYVDRRLLRYIAAHSLLFLCSWAMSDVIKSLGWQRRPNGQDNKSTPSGHMIWAMFLWQRMFWDAVYGLWSKRPIGWRWFYVVSAILLPITTAVLRVIARKHYVGNTLVGGALALLFVDIYVRSSLLIARVWQSSRLSCCNKRLRPTPSDLRLPTRQAPELASSSTERLNAWRASLEQFGVAPMTFLQGSKAFLVAAACGFSYPWQVLPLLGSMTLLACLIDLRLRWRRCQLSSMLRIVGRHYWPFWQSSCLYQGLAAVVALSLTSLLIVANTLKWPGSRAAGAFGYFVSINTTQPGDGSFAYDGHYKTIAGDYSYVTAVGINAAVNLVDLFFVNRALRAQETSNDSAGHQELSLAI